MVTPFPYRAFSTKRRYRYDAVVGETKRAFLVRIPTRAGTVRLPKQNVDFDEVDGEKFFWISDQVAEFIGLIEETTL